MLRKIIILTAILGLSAGCQSHAQHEKAAKQRWAKARASIKLTMAEQQYNNGEYDKALASIYECIGSDPCEPKARLLLGKLMLSQDNLQGAEEQLRLCVQSDASLDEGWYWLGFALQRQERLKEALQHYNKALSLAPTRTEYILSAADAEAAQGNTGKAVELLGQKMEAMPQNVELKVAAADLTFRAGRNEEAIELYKKAMIINSEDDTVAEALGYCYLFSDRHAEAAEIFNRLAERCLDSQKRKLYLEIAGLSNMKSAQYDRASTCYQKLSKEERKNAEVWVKAGQASLGAGDAKRAIMCGQKALSLRPDYPDAIAVIGCAQYLQGDYSAAIKSFEKTESDSRHCGFSWLMRARCYERLGAKEAAEQAYKKGAEISPDSKLVKLLAMEKEER
jgi:tetratricopeptide (TPR) repeat protein